MRKAIRAFVLVMALAIPAFADEIPNGITSPHPPSATTQVGDIQNGAMGDIPYDITGSSVLVTLLVALIS